MNREGTVRGTAISARFWDEERHQVPQMIRVEGAAFGLVAFQQGGPGGVCCMAGASPLEYLCLVDAVVKYGLDGGVDKLAMALTIARALDSFPPKGP